MTSKNLYFKLMKEDIKRRLWAVALLILTFFFTFPVSVVFMAGEGRYVDNQEQWLTLFTRNMVEWLSRENPIMSILIVIIAVICGISSFSYLHSKQKVDFYHSIPVRREKLFLANYLNGILIVAVPYLAGILISVVIAAAKGAPGGTLLRTALCAWLFYMVYYMILYATVVIAVMMTGNVIVSLLGTFVFCSYGPMMRCMIELYFSSWLRSYYAMGRRDVLLDKISPFTSYLSGFSETLTVGYLLSRLLAAVILAAVALLLYQKRPSEAAGKAMAFPISKPIIRILLVVLSAMAGTAFFWQMRASMVWAVFGLICGCVLSHATIEIIYHFDFKKLFSHRYQMMVCGALVLLLSCSFRYDWFGYDTYLPNESQLSSSSIHIGALDCWISYNKEIEKEGEFLWEGVGSDEYKFEHMALKDSKAVIAIASAGIQRNNIIKEKKDSYNQSNIIPLDEQSDEAYFSDITIKYQMKNGKNVYRAYYLPLSQVMDTIDQIYQNPEYKEGVFPILTAQLDDIAQMQYEKMGEFYHSTASAELLEAYQTDLRALTLPQVRESYPIATIAFPSKTEVMKIQAERRRNGWDAYDTKVFQTESSIRGDHYRNYYPIYPSFVNTLEVLKKEDISKANVPDISQVKQFVITDMRTLYSDGEHISGKEITLTEPEEIKSVMPFLYLQSYSNYSSFFEEAQLSATLTIGTGKQFRHLEYFLKPEEIPQNILTLLNYDEMTKRLEERADMGF